MWLGLIFALPVVALAGLVSGTFWPHVLAAAIVAFCNGVAVAWGRDRDARGASIVKTFPIMSAATATAVGASNRRLPTPSAAAATWGGGGAVGAAGRGRLPRFPSAGLDRVGSAGRPAHPLTYGESASLRAGVDAASRAAASVAAESPHADAFQRLTNDAHEVEVSLRRTAPHAWRSRPVATGLPCTDCVGLLGGDGRLTASAGHGAGARGRGRGTCVAPRARRTRRRRRSHRPRAGRRQRRAGGALPARAERAGSPIGAPLTTGRPDLTLASPAMQEGDSAEPDLHVGDRPPGCWSVRTGTGSP